MSDSALHGVIQEYGNELKTPTLVRLYPELARRVRDGGWPYEEFLKQLLESEVNQRRDAGIAGPIGTGKTHLAIALGMEAARRRYRVAFTRTLCRLHQRYLGVRLLIVDELGFTPFDRTEGELLFNLLADHYERRSTLVTTNLSSGEWVQVFGSEKLTTALLDRLVHHAQILTTKGASYRTRKKRETPTISSTGQEHRD